MGLTYSRSNESVENADLPFAGYRYPPKAGNYFSTHFIMGDQTFAGTQPESFLFGANSDLNFLSPRPVSFPYPDTHKSEPTKLLRSLVNLRKDSLKLVKYSEVTNSYYIDFIFDADVKCVVNIYYVATEEFTNGKAVYTTRDPALSSKNIEFEKGACQAFGTFGKFHPIRPDQFKEAELIYSDAANQIPVVIQISAAEVDYAGHCSITLANIEKSSDESYTIRLLKQKQMVDGLCYLLHEIYGLESKEQTETTENKTEDTTDTDDVDDYADENVVCVVCMSDARDTLMLPCKHLCVCSECAGYLRRGSNNCPICRIPFHALLQLCAYQRSSEGRNTKSDDQFHGYSKVDLFDALNAYNIGKDCTSSREIIRRVSARTRTRSRPTTPKAGQKAAQEERMVRRTSSRFSRSSHGSHKRDKSGGGDAAEPVDSLSKSSLRRSLKGSSKSYVVQVEDKNCIVDMKMSDLTDETVEGLEVGVELGQDNLGMEEEEGKKSPTTQKEPGRAEVKETEDTSCDVMAPDPISVRLPGTPLDDDTSDTAGAEVKPSAPSEEQKKDETFVV